MYTCYDNDITCIDSGYIRPQLASFYLLVDQGVAALIDTGTNHSLPRLRQVMRQLDLADTQLRYIIPTHVHLDHAGGAGLLMQEFPTATLVVHPRGARHLIDPTRLIAGARAVYGEQRLHELYGDIVPVEATRVIEAGDGFRLTVGQRKLLFRDTPGHARHHFCVWDVRSRGWFCGDCFGIAYPQLATDRGPFIYPTTTPVQFDPAEMINTLSLLAAGEPLFMYLTHFGRVAFDRQLESDLREQVDAYVDMGRDCQRDTDSERLARRIADFTVSRARAHGCDMAETTLREMLAMDMELNAQGVRHLQTQST